MAIARFLLVLIACTASAGTAVAQAAQARLDGLDAYVRAQMARRQIAGLSLAIIQDGRIAVARAYGVVDKNSGAPVTTTTLFQAGSISKPVSALGALHLVEQGRLSLDGDVNAVLTSWHVPENRFTATEKVTLRRLLSHSAGVTVHGFPGYYVDGPRPSLEQVLDGTPPANTAPIRVDTTPGAIWRYSGGGFTIMQQMMIDVTGTPFPQFMQQTVLGPIGMTNSSFEQPQPPERAARTATGYYANRNPVPGRWHVYPEMAAAGLWTTATDLARFAIEIQETLAGKGHGVLSPAMARQFVTEQNGGSGLGIAVSGSGRQLRFSHGGRDEGFDARLLAFAETGQGVAIMINANDNSQFMGRVVNFIARAYAWPIASGASSPAASQAVPMLGSRLAHFAGYYEAAENQMGALVPNDSGAGLATLVDGLPDEVFLAVDSARFGSVERPVWITFTGEAGGAIDGLTWRSGSGAERRMPRIAPLPSTVTPTPDPDTALTSRIGAALQALRLGGMSLAQAPGVAAGAKSDFRRGVGVTLAGSERMTYVGEQDVEGRGLRRHGGDVARVRYYRVIPGGEQRFVLVYLTARGLVTDYDVVER